MLNYDLLGRPTHTAGSGHYFHMRCLYVSTFQYSSKQSKFQVRIVIGTGENVALAKGIMDDTRLDSFDFGQDKK